MSSSNNGSGGGFIWTIIFAFCLFCICDNVQKLDKRLDKMQRQINELHSQRKENAPIQHAQQDRINQD